MGADEMMDKLDAYLDGQLNPAEREAFERELADHPAVLAEVEKQRSVDASISRLFPMPDAAAMASRLPTTDHSGEAPDVVPISDAAELSGETGKPSPRRQWFMLAALIAICGLAGWRFMVNSEGDAQPDYSTMASAYQTEVSRGFKPLWVCEDDAEFARTFKDRLGQSLLMKPLPQGVRAIGLSYAEIISGKTTFLLANVDGDEVIVFIDNASHGPQSLPSGSRLHLHARQVGSLMLYEVSRLDRAWLLDAFYVPSE